MTKKRDETPEDKATRVREYQREYRQRPEVKERDRINYGKWYKDNKHRVIAANKIWQEKNADRLYSQRLMRAYGISLEDFNSILAKQNGRCKICETDVPGGKGRFHVDHDHENMKIRGLLCHYCNIGIGVLKDDPDLLERAAEYLRAFSRKVE